MALLAASFNLGAAYAGVAIVGQVRDLDYVAVGSSSVTLTAQESAAGKFRATITVPDTFAEGFIEIRKTDGNVHVGDWAISRSDEVAADARFDALDEAVGDLPTGGFNADDRTTLQGIAEDMQSRNR